MSWPEVHLFPASGNCLDFLCCSVREMFRIMDGYTERRTKQGRWAHRPWNRNERATLSILAGAIWRSNPENFVIEEGCGDKVSDAGKYRGRYDICFFAERKQCCGEAKQIWPRSPSSNSSSLYS